jgi:hypothetical protein
MTRIAGLAGILLVNVLAIYLALDQLAADPFICFLLFSI